MKAFWSNFVNSGYKLHSPKANDPLVLHKPLLTQHFAKINTIKYLAHFLHKHDLKEVSKRDKKLFYTKIFLTQQWV